MTTTTYLCTECYEPVEVTYEDADLPLRRVECPHCGALHVLEKRPADGVIVMNPRL